MSAPAWKAKATGGSLTAVTVMVTVEETVLVGMPVTGCSVSTRRTSYTPKQSAHGVYSSLPSQWTGSAAAGVVVVAVVVVVVVAEAA